MTTNSTPNRAAASTPAGTPERPPAVVGVTATAGLVATVAIVMGMRVALAPRSGFLDFNEVGQFVALLGMVLAGCAAGLWRGWAWARPPLLLICLLFGFVAGGLALSWPTFVLAAATAFGCALLAVNPSVGDWLYGAGCARATGRALAGRDTAALPDRARRAAALCALQAGLSMFGAATAGSYLTSVPFPFFPLSPRTLAVVLGLALAGSAYALWRRRVAARVSMLVLSVLGAVLSIVAYIPLPLGALGVIAMVGLGLGCAVTVSSSDVDRWLSGPQ